MQTMTAKKIKVSIGHVTFQLNAYVDQPNTFALLTEGGTKPLFTGILDTRMADELRQLADIVDELEAAA